MSLANKNINELDEVSDDGKVVVVVGLLGRLVNTIKWTRRRCNVRTTTNSAHVLTADDEGSFLIHNNTASSTISIPNDAALPSWPVGGHVTIQRTGHATNTLTVQIVSGSGVTLTTAGRPKLRAQGSVARLIKTGANAWTLEGDTSA